MKSTMLSIIFALSLSAQVLPIIEVQPEGSTQLCLLNDTAEIVGYSVSFYTSLGTPAQPEFELFGPQATLLGGLVPQALQCYKFAPVPGQYWAVNTSAFGKARMFLLQETEKTKAVLPEQASSNERTLPYFQLDAETELIFVNTGPSPISAAAIYYSPGGVEVFRTETLVGPFQQVTVPLEFERLQGLSGTVKVLDTLNNSALVVSTVRRTTTSEVIQ